MKRNRNILILTILLILVAVILYFNRSESSFKNKENNFAIEDTAAITKIFLADKSNNSILLERINQGEWRVNGSYPAGKEVMDMFLETVHRISTKSPVPKSAHNQVIKQLATSSVKVEIYQKVYRINLFNKIQLFPIEKAVKTYYVGGPTQNNMGSFMIMEGAENPFVVHILGFRGYVTPRYSTQEKDWRSHVIFKSKISDIQKITIEIPGSPEESFEVRKKGDEFAVYDITRGMDLPGYDTLKLFNLVTAFYDLRYESLKNDIGRKDSIIQTSPSFILSLTNNKQQTTSIKTFHKPNDQLAFDLEGKLYPYDVDRLYALINDDKDFVLIQYFTFDKVLQPLSYYRLP